MTNFKQAQIKTLDKGGYTHTITLKYPEGSIHFLDKPFEVHRTIAELKLQSDYEYTYESEFTGSGEDYFLSDLDNVRHKGFWAVFKTDRKGTTISGTIANLRTSYSSDYAIMLEEHQGWQTNHGQIKIYRTQEEAEADVTQK